MTKQSSGHWVITIHKVMICYDIVGRALGKNKTNVIKLFQKTAPTKTWRHIVWSKKYFPNRALDKATNNRFMEMYYFINWRVWLGTAGRAFVVEKTLRKTWNAIGLIREPLQYEFHFIKFVCTQGAAEVAQWYCWLRLKAFLSHNYLSNIKSRTEPILKF